MFAYGIGDEVLSVADDERTLKAKMDLAPGASEGWIKPLVDGPMPEGARIVGPKFTVRDDDVLREWDTRPLTDEDVAADRRAAYPAIGDQLDALWKALDRAGLPDEVAAMLARVKQVKKDHPKRV